jgi:type-1 restriction enzyme ecoDI specificity protein
MARAKKETALTPEERLQAALVPDWEWPYKLPENWCWTYFKSISTIQTGKKDANYGSDEGKYPFFTCAAESIRCHGYSFDCRAILLAGNGDINNISRYNGKFEAYQRTYVVKIAEPLCFDYIFYWFKYRWFDFNKGKMFGTAIPYIRLGNLQEFPTPIPPLAEQQRIVDRIESLFAKLDEAKEKAQAVVDSFETRKAAILHKAFTGELTAKWREEHGVSIDNWKTTRFDSVAAIRSNLVDPAEYQSFPHIAPDNIEKKTGVLLEYHTIAEDGVTSGKHRFYSGQILYSKIRPYLSKAVVVDFDGLCSADMYPIEAYQNARCLWYYMLSDEFLLQASTAGSRSVLPKINQKELSALTVHLPTNDREQEEIARILDELFDKEQQTKEAAEIVLDQIDLMKKSILARAFRGELGTNDPSEESAVELLKRVL